MKKFLIAAGISATLFSLYNCHSSKKAQAAVPVLFTYEANVKTVVEEHCSPCHIPVKGGNKKPYDNFANVKSDIDDILRRVQLNPGERGFMPFKKAKLSDSTINVFKKWKDDGMLEVK